MIRFVCECGKQLQARDESAGKLVSCPSCNRQLKVPAESPPPEGVQRGRPILRDEREWEEEPESEERSPAQPAVNSGKAVASLVLGILSLFCNVLAGLPALILGLLAMRDIGRSRGRLSGQGLALAGIVTACVCTLLSCLMFVPISIGLLLPAVQKVREAAGRAESMNNLKRIAIAMHVYHDANFRLPAAGICDKNGKPLLSWRVAILPYIEQEQLYRKFKLDEPWDGPNNKKLLAQMPLIYKLPSDDQTAPDHTHYQVFVGNNAAFDKRSGRSIVDFLDGTSNTILIIVADKAVPWTKPEDVDFDSNKPMLPLLSRHFRSGYLVALVDGSVRVVPSSVSENTLKAAITRNGGEALGPDW
jgi:hypothetical protein